ncbi:MAG: NUDIX domain-containing protein [Candidatus Calescibacterium sp.]|nr:NUDIX domain-containing protein [Candidatus Calescibacterium sp.]MCX7971841.1 NUDIX domain-containing protein [bacterium]MDW8194956.1 NUDIX domain-containing protein [Candidatus Calescibacterium sp.]
MSIKVTVGGLIKYKNLFLLVRTEKWKGKWGIPGGKVKQGETLIKALIREIKEETNLDIQEKQCKYITFFESIYDEEFYKPAHMILFNYLIKVQNISNLKVNQEIIEYNFFKKEELYKIEMNKYTQKLIEKITGTRRITID